MPIYATEYSVKKQEYRILPFKEMLELNHKDILEGHDTEYTLISISITHKEARQAADKHAELLEGTYL